MLNYNSCVQIYLNCGMKLPAGDKVEITVKRADNGEYKEVKVTVTLGRKSDAPQETTDSSSSEENSDSDNGSTNNGSDSNSGQNSRNGGSFFN